MLKNIPPSFSPDFLKLMMVMGHGEEMVISDGNFPASTTGNQSIPRIYLPVTDIASLLKDVLAFFPLDETVEEPLVVMESAVQNGVYEQYRQTAERAGLRVSIGTMERFAFYRRAADAAGIIITASTARGGNIILKKGVVSDDK